ncbi:MAG: winged helix DNA-binding domain-containing protein [Solirubrobacterales bacterium]
MAAGPRSLDPARLPRLRAASQLLHRPSSIREPAELAGAIAGAQAQDVYAGPLTFRSRNSRLTAADINRARTEERSLLRTWVMRMTIHLIPSDDAWWWLPLFEPGIEKWSRRRLGQLGMPARTQERALREVVRMLEREGPLTRTEVGNRLRGMGIELDNWTRGHIMGLAVSSGNACLGPDRKGVTCLVLRRDWLGEQKRFDREAALAELARRYLRAFGPATDRDFAYWAGLGLGEVRAGLKAISGELEEVRVGEETLVALRGALPRPPPAGQVRMLGDFDTYLLGWKDRAFSVPDHHLASVKEGGGGWIRPVIVRDGIVIGGWRSSRKGGRIEITLDPPASEHSAAIREAIDAEIDDIARFEGMPVKLASS